MRVVVALGGNALVRRGQRPDVETQRGNVRVAVGALVQLVQDGHQLVVTHGNGPQVGLLAMQAAAYGAVPAYPLDVLGAESEGMIGYLLDQELVTALPDQPVATLLTQVVVDPADPAFENPTKPIGLIYDEHTAEELRRKRQWVFAKEARGFRRVVASPEPKRIIEIATIRLLIDHGVLVLCAGGGGIPVAIGDDGVVRGVEAVVDKDLSACELATEVDADALLLLTDVDAVYRDWGSVTAERVARATPAELRALSLPAGSMGPKAEAVARFVERTGRVAAIGALEHAAEVLTGARGTWVHADTS